jgi:hypothetical protein
MTICHHQHIQPALNRPAKSGLHAPMVAWSGLLGTNVGQVW